MAYSDLVRIELFYTALDCIGVVCFDLHCSALRCALLLYFALGWVVWRPVSPATHEAVCAGGI